jgi:hypothetical protein
MPAVSSDDALAPPCIAALDPTQGACDRRDGPAASGPDGEGIPLRRGFAGVPVTGVECASAFGNG